MAVIGLVNQETPAANLPNLYADLNVDAASIMNQLVLSPESIIGEYSRIRQLPASQRQAIAASIRTNFGSFMNGTFYLTNNQISCVTNYWTDPQDVEFKNFLAARIEAGDAVTWQVDLTNSDVPPVGVMGRKKRKIEAGWSEKEGYKIGVGIEF